MTKEQENQIAALIKSGCAANREEAIQILREDDDESFVTDEMREIEKRVKATRKNARAVNAYGKEVKRERKPNEAKRAIIALLADALECAHHLDEEELASHIEAVNTTNEERQIDFTLDGRHFSVTLTEHREPKDKG